MAQIFFISCMVTMQDLISNKDLQCMAVLGYLYKDTFVLIQVKCFRLL